MQNVALQVATHPIIYLIMMFVLPLDAVIGHPLATASMQIMKSNAPSDKHTRLP